MYSILLMLVACAGGDKSNDTSDTTVEDTSGDTDGSGSGGNDTDGQDTVTVDGEYVDPDCVDGQYSEVVPTPNANIDSIKDTYSSNNVEGFISDVLGQRFTVGQYIFQQGIQATGNFPDTCLNYFLGDSSSAGAVIGQLSTIVHECGHFLDLDLRDWGENVYVFTDELTITCEDGSTPDNGGGRTFSRSLINDDVYASLHPPCANFTDQGCDSYAAIYLDGDPNNSNFESGDQGYGMLHEETLQYVNSLATSYAFGDQLAYSTSARDGILTFLWYTMRYLRLARLEHPQTYTHLSQNSCWRDLILNTWGRAWLYLELTAGTSNLGINDDFLMTLVMEPELLSEIQRLRDIEGCQ